MPVISRFLGIIVFMFWRDHNPPHFHAKYGEYEALISLEGIILDGKLPRRIQSLVLEWLALHRLELLENWELAQKGKQLKDIIPLE
jgi:hypothetical protein